MRKRCELLNPSRSCGFPPKKGTRFPPFSRTVVWGCLWWWGFFFNLVSTVRSFRASLNVFKLFFLSSVKGKLFTFSLKNSLWISLLWPSLERLSSFDVNRSLLPPELAGWMWDICDCQTWATSNAHVISMCVEGEEREGKNSTKY